MDWDGIIESHDWNAGPRSLPENVRMIINDRLAERPDEHERLRGAYDKEWEDAYKRLLMWVFKRMRKLTSEDWRDWCKIQLQVKHEVDKTCESLRQS